MKNKAIAIILCAAAAGCTPGVYRGWADSQVQDILRDRKKQTLGYRPDVEANTTVPERPSKAAYDKIPTTPIPPPAPPPLDPARVTIEFGELGPEVPPPDDGPAGVPGKGREPNPYDRSPLNGKTADRLRLGPPTPAELGTQLDLFRAVEYAVQHSRAYQSEMEDLYLRTLDVTLQRHLFGPRPFVTQDFDYRGGQRDVNYRSSLNAVTTAGVRQQLPYGGEVVAQALAGTVREITGNVTEGQSAEVALSASIPLLRGFGLVNLEPLINSERQLVYEIRAFEDFRRQFAVDIATRYFNLIAQQQQLANARLNYTNLSTLTNRTQALYQAGRVNFLEVQRSAQDLLNAESLLITQEETYQTALDNFKIVLGMSIGTDLEVVPVELDLRIPQAEPTEAIDLATRYRLDLQTARDRIEDARRGVQNAKNGLLPDVDLRGSVGLSDRDEDPLLAFEERSATYSAGVRIDLPVDRLRERNVYRASLISLQRSQRSYEELRDRVSVAARDALRGIASAQTELEIQRIGIELAQKRLDFSNELLKSAVIGSRDTSRDVLEAQRSLLTAQNAYARSRSNLQISVLEYLRQTGTLRVDPDAGALGRAMSRTGPTTVDTEPANNPLPRM